MSKNKHNNSFCISRCGLWLLSFLILTGCSNPSVVKVPESGEQQTTQRLYRVMEGLPVNEGFSLQAGDRVSIIRDSEPIQALQANSYEFTVGLDGYLRYPNAAPVMAAGKSVEAVSEEITEKLGKTFKHPKVSVNVVSTPGYRFFVGGAVRVPSQYPLVLGTTIEQAIITAGGILNVADSQRVALLRPDQDNNYRVYFYDYGGMLTASNKQPVYIQRGDVVYVPKSSVGNFIDSVDLYLNQLIPFNKNIGYQINNPN